MKPPIIIGSAPSTGSTLLRILLGRHPSIASGGELAVFDKPALLAASVDEYRGSITRWLADGMPVPFVGGSRELFRDLEEYPWRREEVEELARSVHSTRELLDRFFARHVERAGASRWLEKTPSNVYCFGLVKRFYPEARLIHIVRDGRDAVVSYSRREPSALRAVARWYCATLAGIQWRCHPHYREVRYEELVTEPERVLRAICRFLEEPYTEEMLRPADPYGRGPGGWRLDPGDAVAASSIGRYQEEMTDEQRSLFTHLHLSFAGRQALAPNASTIPESPLALQSLLGYSTESLEDAPPLTRQDALALWQPLLRHRASTLKRYAICPPSHIRLSM